MTLTTSGKLLFIMAIVIFVIANILVIFKLIDIVVYISMLMVGVFGLPLLFALLTGKI